MFLMYQFTSYRSFSGHTRNPGVRGRILQLNELRLVRQQNVNGKNGSVKLKNYYFLNFFPDESDFFGLFEFLFRNRLLDFQSLVFRHFQLCLRLFGFGLIWLIGFHGGMQLVKYSQYLLVDLVTDLPTLKTR